MAWCTIVCFVVNKPRNLFASKEFCWNFFSISIRKTICNNPEFAIGWSELHLGFINLTWSQLLILNTPEIKDWGLSVRSALAFYESVNHAVFKLCNIGYGVNWHLYKTYINPEPSYNLQCFKIILLLTENSLLNRVFACPCPLSHWLWKIWGKLELLIVHCALGLRNSNLHFKPSSLETVRGI